MARGWESKAIESQQDDAAARKSMKPAQTAEQREQSQRRHTLELSRARLTADLERASAQPHREMLERALADLAIQLDALS